MGKRIGITGGIGSGKSVVCHIVQSLGYPVYDSDTQAKWLMEHSPAIRTALTSLLGKETYQDNTLNKKYIAQRIFGNSVLLQQVNNIVHPIVFDHFEEWCKTKDTYPFLFTESALLYQTHFDRFLDEVWMVQAPMELRIERSIKRDSSTRLQIQQRINNQQSIHAHTADALLIINDDKTPLLPQILSLLQK